MYDVTMGVTIVTTRGQILGIRLHRLVRITGHRLVGAPVDQCQIRTQIYSRHAKDTD